LVREMGHLKRKTIYKNIKHLIKGEFDERNGGFGGFRVDGRVRKGWVIIMGDTIRSRLRKIRICTSEVPCEGY